MPLFVMKTLVLSYPLKFSLIHAPKANQVYPISYKDRKQWTTKSYIIFKDLIVPSNLYLTATTIYYVQLYHSDTMIMLLRSWYDSVDGIKLESKIACHATKHNTNWFLQYLNCYEIISRRDGIVGMWDSYLKRYRLT